MIHLFPGIMMTKDRSEIQIAGYVVQRDALLELFACTDGKEHESVVWVDARPKDIHAALLLLGLKRGRPATWDENGNMSPPTGDLVDVSVQYQEGGRTIRRAAHEWIVESKTSRPSPPLQWVFCGSKVLEDGTYLGDLDGNVIAITNFDSAVLDLPAAHSNLNSLLWASADPKRTPPLNTLVAVVIAPARRDEIGLAIDRFGRVYLDSIEVDRTELTDKLRPFVGANKELRVRIHRAPRTLRADVDFVVLDLVRAGVDRERITSQVSWSAESRPAATPLFPESDLRSAESLMSDFQPSAARLMAAIAEERRRFVESLQRDGERLRDLADDWRSFVERLIDQLKTSTEPEDES
jgi:biopolymer transport protein ExbD